jgi:hypothetical protein
MTNQGRLIECWLVTCASCNFHATLSNENGTDMSRSQAKRKLIEGHLWVYNENDDLWYCDDCAEELQIT